MRLPARIHAPAHRRGLHGERHVDREHEIALWMILTALFRVFLIWTPLMVLYVIGVPFAVTLFKSVAFVSFISMLALWLTDWGQFAASLAQLTASHAHSDIEAHREHSAVRFEDVEQDIAKLAELQPCAEADALAESIRARLRS